MKTSIGITGLLAGLLAICGCSKENGAKITSITGAGASFPAPVYQNWTHTYTQSNTGCRVIYHSLGSGAGINQLKAKTIDFAGSDAPLTLAEQKEAALTQFPMLMGGVVVIANLQNAALELKLSRKALAAIFLGKITRWNDAELKALNPDAQLPEQDITVVHRADASGTSFIFTDYLARISDEWRRTAGSGTSVNWPTGIGGQKNPGVCNNVAKIYGAIGYTEYTYAAEAKLFMPLLENKAGSYPAPAMESFQEAAASADWSSAPGFYMLLNDQGGVNAWPIMGASYILFRTGSSQETQNALLKYFNWCFTEGATAARKLNYVPMPQSVIALVQAAMPRGQRTPADGNGLQRTETP